MRFRWKLVMIMARILRVKMYEHWSEHPAYLFEDDIEVRCDRCKKKAERNISGTPLCSRHDEEIRLRRSKTGIAGTIEKFEWETDLSVRRNWLGDFAMYYANRTR